MAFTAEKKKTVAVVGSGMAGLVTAYLLQQRYNVELFESGGRASLDSASISVDEDSQSVLLKQRVDVPMRAFSKGYYPNLVAMYDYLGIEMCRQRMRFAFSQDYGTVIQKTAAHAPRARSISTYFLHASNLHAFPRRPHGSSLISYLGRLIFVGICYIWFTVVCSLLPAKRNESLGHYLRRTWVPAHFTHWYILPLLSSVATCSHSEMLDFPAQDLVIYRRKLIGEDHYVVRNGVRDVERKLLAGLNIQLNACVELVELTGTWKKVTWRQQGTNQTCHRKFDEVVLAVPPNVVSRIFSPARSQLSRLKTVSVETVVHKDGAFAANRMIDCSPACLRKDDDVQAIHLHTRTHEACTEATHVQGSVMVTTSPLTRIDNDAIVAEYMFTRVIRNTQGRHVTRGLLGLDVKKGAKVDCKWTNGQFGVWISGAWCWDGIPLLEGCIVSAMAVATELRVDIPWQNPEFQSGLR